MWSRICRIREEGMKKMEVSAFDLAQRFIGVKEIPRPGLDTRAQIFSVFDALCERMPVRERKV